MGLNKKSDATYNKCPKCKWMDDNANNWNCQSCNYEMNMFENVGICPRCNFQHTHVICVSYKGGCDEISPIEDWYSEIDEILRELDIFRGDQD